MSGKFTQGFFFSLAKNVGTVQRTKILPKTGVFVSDTNTRPIIGSLKLYFGQFSRDND